MLLCVDIGNTNVDLGLFARGALREHCKLPTRDCATRAAWAAGVAACLERWQAGGQVHAAAVASVVADRADMAAAALAGLVRGPCEVVDAAWDLGLVIDYEDPQTVGIDRLLAAAAAFAGEQGRGGVVVADAGTALTVDVVDRGGVFRGGLIVPGLHLGLRALHAGTSLLPPVVPAADAPLLGRSTRACMLAGSVHGTAAMLTELCARIAAHLDQRLALYLTGGDAAVLAPLVHPLPRVEPALVLQGLALAVDRRHGRPT